MTSAPLLASGSPEVDIETGDDDKYRCFRTSDTAAKTEFSSNEVTTSKYSFFPLHPRFILWRNLWEQFGRYANRYFLFIACLQIIPGLSPTGRFSTLGPLMLVLMIQLFKDGYEDGKRHLRDHDVNNQKARVWRGEENEWKTVVWNDILVGDIVEVDHDEEFCKGQFPCDLLLIWSSEPQGMCNIETSNLDGETNLKLRNMHREKGGAPPFDKSWPKGYSAAVKCEKPNKNLYRFEGQFMRAHDGQIVTSPIDVGSVLLRGSALGSGTKCVAGIVIYTGSQTKLMMNQQETRTKVSRLEQQANIFVAIIFGVLLFMVLLCGIALAVTSGWADDHWYLCAEGLNPGLEALKGLGTFTILFNNLIPISLYVSMEMCKIGQAQCINWDETMYHDESDTPADTKTSSLNEELGQIQYIFSDKTGTLTCNIMDFFRFSVGSTSYGSGITEIGLARAAREGKSLPPQPEQPPGTKQTKGFSFYDPKISNGSWLENEDAAKIERMLQILAVCHTVISEEDRDGQLKYQAASPDEACLVEGARQLGVTYLNRDLSSVTISVVERGGGLRQETWQLLDILEFTSTRKRMSVIVRDPAGSLFLMCKGADNVMFDLLRPETDEAEGEVRLMSKEFLVEYASDGLRTLCIAQAAISEQFYASWAPRFKEACESIGQRAENMAAVSAEIERDLELIGTTAIEDKLQGKVPETIQLLRAAGINIWVLTGDKQETAINIGFACGLLTNDMKCFTFDSTEGGEKQTTLQIRNSLDKAKAYISKDPPEELSLVVQGAVLSDITSPDAPRVNREMFLELAQLCKSVVACRVSPAQKAEVVDLVKSALTKSDMGATLSIGDGANDVAMINEAHVGVGISGLEGLQAARAADYSIAQFRFLAPLLLVHGRWSYRRVAKVVLYSFYKNAVLYTTQFWFCFLNAFTGQSLYDVWAIAAFNIIFTAMPVLAVGMLDRDIRLERILALDQYPELYATGREWQMFNPRTFGVIFAEGALQSAICFYIPLCCHIDSQRPDGGNAIGLQWVGMTCYTAVVWVATCKICLMATSFTSIHVVVTILSIFSWYLFVMVYGEIFSPTLFGTAWYRLYRPVLADPSHWGAVFLCIPIAGAREFLWKFYKRNYDPGLLEVIQGADGRADAFSYPGCKMADLDRVTLAEQGYLNVKVMPRFKSRISEDAEEEMSGLWAGQGSGRQESVRVIDTDVLKDHTGYAMDAPGQEDGADKGRAAAYAARAAMGMSGTGQEKTGTSWAGSWWKFSSLRGRLGGPSTPKGSPVPSPRPVHLQDATEGPPIAVAD